MSYDPRKANIVEDESSEIPWMKRPPTSEAIWGGIAGEDMGLGTKKRFPLREINYAGIPLYLSQEAGAGGHAEGEHKAMVAAQYKNYSGILMKPTYSGEAVKRTRMGHINIAAGIDANGISAPHMVMCDPENTYGELGDVVQQFTEQQLTYFTPAAGVAADADLDLSDFLPDGCWKIKSIVSGSILDVSTPGNVALTVIADDTADPGAGEISLQPTTGDNIVKIGTALADGDVLLLKIQAYDDRVYQFTVGRALKDANARTDADTYERTRLELV